MASRNAPLHAAGSEYKQWFFSGQYFGEGTFHEQAVSALTMLKEDLATVGVEAGGVVKCTISLTDTRQIPACVQLYRELVSETLPTMTFLAQGGLCGGRTFSVDVVAVRTDACRSVQRFYRETDGDIPCSIRAGEYVFTSLCGAGLATDMASQARAAIRSMLEAFALAGCAPEKIARNLVYLTDCSLFDAYNAVYAEFFHKDADPPARSLMGVSALPAGGLSAVEGIGYLGERREELFSAEAPVSKAPFCQGIRIGDLLFVSGQVGTSVKLGALCHPFAEETRQTFRNLLSILGSGGARAENVLKCSGYLRGADDTNEFRAVRREVLLVENCADAIQLVEGLARPTLSMEVDVIAAAPEEN